ncbi:unnamed protein product [Caenorhabditis auriculariae]|uniref:Uncharacterized protein n=1 Tax=Caenorhabditis auriculariae TaxID=2777116 RepID=A0A8S1GP92_9PELO|nr:unnamed protein product [Caenorhabditis auriculariae]
MVSRAALLIFGGCSYAKEKGALNSIEAVSVQIDSTGKPIVQSELCGTLKSPRRSPSVFHHEYRGILICGGCSGEGQHLDSMEVLKVENKNCESKEITAKLVAENSCAAFSHFKNKRLIFGGFNGFDCLTLVQIIHGGSEKEDLKVQLLKGSLPRLKNAVCCNIDEEYFLLVGGWEDEKRTSAGVRRVDFDEDFTEVRNEFLTSLPYPVEGHSVVKKGRKLFVIGGYDGIRVQDKIVVFDLESRKSEILDTKLTIPRENHVSGIIGEKYLVVAGGWDSRNSLDSVELLEIIEETPCVWG